MTGAGAVHPLLAMLEEAARRPNDGHVLRESSGRSIGLRGLHDRATHVRDALVASGMEPGDHVLFAVRPGIDQLTLALAICDAGGVIVTCDPRIPDALFQARLDRLTPRWLVADALVLALTSRRRPSRLIARIAGGLAPLGAVKDLQRIRVGSWLPGQPPSRSLDALVRQSAPRRLPPDVDSLQPALIEFTSGTTAAPKGIVHTRQSLAATIDAIRTMMGAGPGDVVLTGALHLMVPALLLGARVVIPRREGEGPARTLEVLEREGVTHVFMATSACREMVEHCIERGRGLPDKLRLVMLGSAPVHAPLLARLRTVLPAPTQVVCVYGMTEMLPVATATLEEKVNWTESGDLLGRPVPGACARVAANGELVISGPALFDRYLGGERVSELRTGDIARIHEGQIVLLGRAKDMIIRRAFNLYPELYEPIIEGIPGVRRCAFVGLYDEQLADEVVVLAVEPEASADANDLMRRLPDALRAGPFRIDPLAVPDHIVAMPLPESGRSSKVDKVALRELLKDRVL